MGNFLGLFRTRNENRVKRVGGTLYLQLVCFLVVLVCLFVCFFPFFVRCRKRAVDKNDCLRRV